MRQDSFKTIEVRITMEINTALVALLAVISIIVTIIGVGWRITSKITRMEILFTAYLEQDKERIKVNQSQCHERHDLLQKARDSSLQWLRDVEGKIDNFIAAGGK